MVISSQRTGNDRPHPYYSFTANEHKSDPNNATLILHNIFYMHGGVS